MNKKQVMNPLKIYRTVLKRIEFLTNRGASKICIAVDPETNDVHICYMNDDHTYSLYENVSGSQYGVPKSFLENLKFYELKTDGDGKYSHL